MRPIRCLSALAFVAALATSSPAAAVTTVKIISADGTWLNYTTYTSYSLYASVFGYGWGCAGAATGPGKFLGGAGSASCSGNGSGSVYFSGGEWWIDYP